MIVTRARIPLAGDPPAEVHLPRAPLIRVIAQVRFAPILAIRQADNVAPFQEIIRSTYPVLNEEQVHQIVLTPTGAPTVKQEPVWRFSEREKEPKWRVSLSADFLALETSAYVNRRDFLDRLRLVAVGFVEVFKPGELQRFGLRYIDRLVDDALDNIGDLVRPEILGILSPPPESSLGGAVIYSLTEAQFVAQEGTVQTRWGKLPAGSTFDPGTLDPIDKESWILDLDMFTPTPRSFDAGDLMMSAEQFSNRLYAIFRAMVRPEFLRFYGGEL
jgi:uncharacterized protein (TIGR04255 family)